MVYLILTSFKDNNCQCDMNIHDNNDNTDRDFTLQVIAATAGNNNNVHHVVIEVYDMTNDTIVSVSVSDADEATFSVLVSPSYDIDSLSLAIYDEDSSAGNDSLHIYISYSGIIMMMTALHELPSAIHDGIFSTATFNAESDTDAMAAPAVMVEPYDTRYKSPSAAIMKTTALYTSHSMQRDTSVIDAQSSAGITKTTTPYASPSAVKMMTTDMNTVVYFSVIDV